MSCLVVAKLSVARSVVALFPTWNRGMFKICDFRAEKVYLSNENSRFRPLVGLHKSLFFALCSGI